MTSWFVGERRACVSGRWKSTVQCDCLLCVRFQPVSPCYHAYSRNVASRRRFGKKEWVIDTIHMD